MYAIYAPPASGRPLTAYGETRYSTFGKGLLFDDDETSPFSLIRFHMPISGGQPVDSRMLPIAGSSEDDTGAFGEGCIWVGSGFNVYSDMVDAPFIPKNYPYRSLGRTGYSINRHEIYGGESTLKKMTDIVRDNCGSCKVKASFSEPPELPLQLPFNNNYIVYFEN